MISFFAGFQTSAASSAGLLLSHVFTVFYYALWIFPLYVASLVLSTFWVQDIFDEAYRIAAKEQQVQEAKNKRKPLPVAKRRGTITSRVSEEIVRFLLVLGFLVQTFALSLVPLFGDLLKIMHLSWLYSFYCFEYKICALGFTTR